MVIPSSVICALQALLELVLRERNIRRNEKSAIVRSLADVRNGRCLNMWAALVVVKAWSAAGCWQNFGRCVNQLQALGASCGFALRGCTAERQPPKTVDPTHFSAWRQATRNRLSSHAMPGYHGILGFWKAAQAGCPSIWCFVRRRAILSLGTRVPQRAQL